MYTGIYKIADHIFEVHSLFADIHLLCEAYAVEEQPTFCITVTPENLTAERAVWESEVEKGHIPAGNVTDSFLETVFVHQTLADMLVKDGYLLFHGSAIAVDGEAYLFTAPSGTGKSTHTRLWREHFGDRAIMVNDDKPILKITENGTTVYGTPWNGKHRLSRNIAVPLKALIQLERAEENHIEPIDKKTAYPILFRQAHRPADPVGMVAVMKMLDQLSEHTALYRLGCNMQPEAAIVAYEGMNGRGATA